MRNYKQVSIPAFVSPADISDDREQHRYDLARGLSDLRPGMAELGLGRVAQEEHIAAAMAPSAYLPPAAETPHHLGPEVLGGSIHA